MAKTIVKPIAHVVPARSSGHVLVGAQCPSEEKLNSTKGLLIRSPEIVLTSKILKLLAENPEILILGEDPDGWELI